MEEIEELRNKLKDLDKRVEKIENLIFSEEKDFETVEEKIENFAEEFGVERKDLYHVFDFDLEEEEIYLTQEIEGKNEKEKQFKTTLSLLTAYQYIFNKNTLKSQKLREKLNDLSIKSLVNLSTNLSEYRKYVRPRGKPKSTDYSYQITPLGKEEGMKLINNLLGSEN